MNGLVLASLLAAVAPNGAVARHAAAPAVEIRIALRASTLWVGEPIRMEVHWTAVAAATIKVERDDLCFEAVRLLVRGPRGDRIYRERPREICEPVRAPWDMRPGEEIRTRLVFFGIGGWVDGDLRSTRYEPSIIFPQPGEYALRLVYIGGKADVLSNEVDVTVAVPPAGEQALLQQILRQPTITYAPTDWLERLQQHPTSRYLAWSRLVRFGHRVNYEAMRDREAENRRRLDIIAEVLAQDWGQFEEDALALAYRAARPLGDAGQAAEIAARLRAKFPGSWTVQDLGLDKPDDDDEDDGEADVKAKPPDAKKP